MPVATHAQIRPQPFETIDVALALLTDRNDALLQRYWDPGLGVEGTVRMPFYAGAVELGLQQFHHDPRRWDVPGFRARFLFFGWGIGGPVTGRLRWDGGIRAGIYDMRFDGDTIPDFRRSENELGTALRAALDYLLGRRWRAGIAGAYQVVFTSDHLEQLLLSVSVARQFRTPPWLRRVLD
jgi:hypothetical protein